VTDNHLQVFHTWNDHWKGSTAPLDHKLKTFTVASPLAARGIFQQLVVFLRTFSDPERLERYGLAIEGRRREDLSRELFSVAHYLKKIDSRFSTKDLTSFDQDRLRHLDFLQQKARYALISEGSPLDDLIERLDDLNRMLQLLTAPIITEDMVTRKVLESAVKDIWADTDLTRRLEEAATYEMKHSIDPTAKAKYDDLSKFANFSLAVKSATPDIPRKKIFSRSEFSFDSPYEISPYATLARLFDYPIKLQSRLVLVEWRRIRRSEPLMESLDKSKMTWFVLHVEKPDRMLLPPAIGYILDDADPRNVGFVYQLPSHIRGNLPTKPVMHGDLVQRVVRSPKTIAAQRMPTTLRQLILKREPSGIDLSIRFQLAKALLDAVHLIHAAGWLHRNIRPDNILFFPAVNRMGEPDPTTLDYNRPMLVGFHDAPFAIEFIPDSSQATAPYTQPEGLKPILKNSPATRKLQPRDVVVESYNHPERRLTSSFLVSPFPSSPSSTAATIVSTNNNGSLVIKPSLDSLAYHRQQCAYDLYSVGCVLLELGLWTTLDHLGGREIPTRVYHALAAVENRGGGELSGKEVEDLVWKDVDTIRKATKGLEV